MAFKDKEKEKEYMKRYHEAHKKDRKEYDKRYYEKNKERIDERTKKYFREVYYESNKQKIMDNTARWNQAKNAETKKYATNSNAKWTVEEDALVLELKKNGLSCSKIAIIIGRSFISVKNRLAILHRKQKAEAMDELMGLITAYCLVSKE